MGSKILKILKAFAKAAGFGEPKNPVEIIAAIVASILSFVGVIFLCLMIYGGFIWMTATGNQQKVEKAKKIVVDATIGVVIIFAAYVITTTVLSSLGAAVGV